MIEKVGRGEWIRTTDLLVPNQHISITYRQRSLETQDLHVFCLDPIWTLKAKVWRTGGKLDPAWTLVSSSVIQLHSRAVPSAIREPVQNMLLRRDFQNRHIGAHDRHRRRVMWRSGYWRELL